jgi:hypothetical protein
MGVEQQLVERFMGMTNLFAWFAFTSLTLGQFVTLVVSVLNAALWFAMVRFQRQNELAHCHLYALVEQLGRAAGANKGARS